MRHTRRHLPAAVRAGARWPRSPSPQPLSPVRAQDLRAFLGWAITTGAAQLARVNFQPLPSPVVTLSGAQIAKIKADT